MSRRRTGRERLAVLVTCEHGGNHVPQRYASLFAAHRDLLASHRGYDAGSLAMARTLARTLDAGLIATTTTRLLVDLNRSIGHRALYSDVTRRLPRDERSRMIDDYYRPYRTAVEATIGHLAATGHRVLHVSAHSFTPELDGIARNADIGLLYDPSRAWERSICMQWQQALRRADPELVVRRNYPYRGAADGFTTALRREFGPTRYAGVEIEVNQRHPFGHEAGWRRLRRQSAVALREVVEG